MAKKDFSTDVTWKDKVIQGSTFPGAPYKTVRVSLEKEILNEYIPELKKFGLKRGFELLLIAMTDKEGFYKGTRSYRTNNPGNIGNTDGGKNVSLATLHDGIKRQVDFVTSIVDGRHKRYPMGKRVEIAPFYSAEIARNANVYGMSPWLPGYDFVFTGQLDQFVKIYSTGARAGNNYVNTIVSLFRENGYDITPESKIQDIINLE